MVFFCKRNKYILKKRTARNNLGHITIRSRQNIKFNLTQLKNINYNYIFFHYIKEYIKNKIIKLKILEEVIDCKLQKVIYKIIFLNGPLIGHCKYYPKTHGIKKGDILFLGNINTLKEGSLTLIKSLFCGSWLHNIASLTSKASIFVKRSKKSALLLSIGQKYATIILPSGNIRLIDKNVFCIYGELDLTFINVQKKKAGIKRYFGKRPSVRGTAMNACDHPHGGGEGRSSIGRTSIFSPWGSFPKGRKTRKKKKYSSKLILKIKK